MTTLRRERQVQEGEAYGAGSEVPETLLRVEKETRTMLILGREGKGGQHEVQQRTGRGMDAAERSNKTGPMGLSGCDEAGRHEG